MTECCRVVSEVTSFVGNPLQTKKIFKNFEFICILHNFMIFFKRILFILLCQEIYSTATITKHPCIHDDIKVLFLCLEHPVSLTSFHVMRHPVYWVTLYLYSPFIHLDTLYLYSFFPLGHPKFLFFFYQLGHPI